MTKKITSNWFKKRTRAVIVIAFAVVGVVVLSLTQAATPGSVQNLGGGAAFSVSPSSASVPVGSTLILSLYVDSGADPVGAFDARLTYDSSKFNFVNIDNIGGTFPDCFEKSGSANNGQAGLVCSKLGGSYAGRQKIGELKLSAKAAATDTPIGFAAGSHIYKADGVPTDIWNGSTSGGAYDLTAAATGGTGGGTPTTTGGSGTSSTSGTSGTTGSPRPSTSTTVKASPTTVGTSSGTVPQTNVVPTTVPASSAPNTIGVAVTLVIVDTQGKSVAGANVTLAGRTVKSNAQGVAQFTNVTPGSYAAVIKTAAGSRVLSVTVSKDEAATQQFKLTYKSPTPVSGYILYALIAVGAVVFVVLLSVLRRKIHSKKEFSRRFSGLNNKVMVDGNSADNSSASQSSSSFAPAPNEPNDLVAAVVTPHDKTSLSSEEEKALRAIKKPIVESTDTLEEIERKVGAKKATTPARSAHEAADFTPNLILPKKTKPTH